MRNNVVMAMLAVLMLASCSGCMVVKAVKDGVADHGAEVADKALEAAVWNICTGTSVGAFRRRFRTEEELNAIKVICE